MSHARGLHWIRNRSAKDGHSRCRRGFLIVDLLAGVALAGLALALVAMVIKSDIQVRRASEARYRCLIRFENCMARAETLEAGALDESAIRGMLSELTRLEGAEVMPAEVIVTGLTGSPAGKRVVLRTTGDASRVGTVFLMRDFYPGPPGAGGRP
ncbi:hypothetical protein GC170_13360 [bacterium]|nr:hypothetical protein [bacterium]